ncbi:MAG: response regulator transcription factor [Bacteroidales bacterium]|jgi:DNA-binding NarL/FixJ family response regulator|nr:response regulator transcription factor [Bacteroidales bacterium]
MNKIRVILVDDHELVRDGIKSLLSKSPEIEVIGEAGDFYLLKSILTDLNADVILMDINLPNISGIEAVRMLKPEFPNLKFLMLSMYNNEDFVINAVKAGASGYLPKNTTHQELSEAINTIYQGNDYFSKSISEKLFLEMMRRTKIGVNQTETEDAIITTREKEILTKVAEGLSNAEIADQLCISIRTVETHKTNLFKKLKFSSTVDLVKYAIKHKLIRLDT